LFLEHFSAEQASSRTGLMTFQLLIAGVLVFLPAMFMGMLFPLGLRIALGDGERPSMETGRLYLSNTAGCVIGALLAGLVLIPLAGVLATLLIAVGIIAYSVLLVQAEVRGQIAQAALGLVLALCYGAGWYVTPAWNAQLMASGISEYVHAYQAVDAAELPAEVARRSELLFYQDGLTATVTVTRNRVSPSRDLYISTNGKIDGSSRIDMPTQKLSAHLPLLIHEAPDQVAVIGLGTGVTAGSATLHDTVQRVDVVEIEPAMVEGARFFSEFNHDVLESDKARMLITDGRLHLMRSRGSYDVVISEPSNPWIAGVASLFTEEFYQLGASALRDGGIFVQWLQVYDMHLEDIQSVIGTFQSVFPHTYVAMTLFDADLLFIGSKRPLSMDPDRLQERMRQPEVAADLADPWVRVESVEDLLARVWLAPTEVESFVESAPLHRDDWPFLMYRAPLNRYTDTRRRNTAAIAGAAAGLLPEWSERGVEPERLKALARAYDRFVPRPLRWSDQL
jgi:spermidine synthase